MDMVRSIHTPQELAEVGTEILAWHKARGGRTLVITLHGDLGAGKTTFTQQLGRELGVSEPITSPTFTIMRQYELQQKQYDSLVHIDAYRFETENEAKPLRLEEVFATPRAIVCVEWPERILSLLPKDVVSVVITIADGEERLVKIHFPEESGRGA
jgi:tRNA threonylcarbamoyladenosine biosynthesis protein TsaE